MRYVEEYCAAGRARDDNIAHAHCVCVPKATNTHMYILRICNTYCFPLQQWLPGRASILNYTYIVFLVKDWCKE
jgi:hypothetical protein